MESQNWLSTGGQIQKNMSKWLNGCLHDQRRYTTTLEMEWRYGLLRNIVIRAADDSREYISKQYHVSRHPCLAK